MTCDKQSEGERIVRYWWPKYKKGHWQERLAEQIDEAITKSSKQNKE